MGDSLKLPQVTGALQRRGLDITALEHFSKEDFRHLLDGIEFAAPQFQKSYTSKNEKWVIALNFLVVLALNARLIRIYEILAANQNLTQAISGTASTMVNAERPGQNTASGSQTPNPAEIYDRNRQTITEDMRKYPILLRTSKYAEDVKEERFNETVGLLLMGILISMGAPFWNDVLKGMMGVNNALNTNGKKTP